MLVRHGSTAHSAEMRFSGRNDLPLDAAGEVQAAALARRPFGAVQAIVASPLPRTRRTAQVIGAALGLEPTIVPEFAELDFGRFEGLSMREVREQYPEELAAWLGSGEVAPPGGESFAELAVRVERGRDAVLTAHPGQTVLVVTHVSPIKTLVRLALDAPASSIYRMHLDTASVSTIDYYAGGTSSLRLFNDVSHLQPIS